MGEEIRESVVLSRDISFGNVVHTELAVAEVIWPRGKPEQPNYLGNPTGATNWKIIDAQPIVETAPETPVIPAEMPEDKSKDEKPVERKAFQYKPPFKENDKVALISVDPDDKKAGLKVGMVGKLVLLGEAYSQGMPQAIFKEIKKDSFALLEEQFVLAKEYKPEKKKGGKK